AAYKYIYQNNNNNCNRAHSQHKAESEALINISHKVYIDRSLAFSRDNHVVDLGRPRLPVLQGWQFCTRSEEAYHLWSKHALVHMQTNNLSYRVILQIWCHFRLWKMKK